MKPQVTTPPLTDKQARELGKQIVKDSGKLRVKFGKTNGRNVLHIYEIGFRDRETGLTSKTIKSRAEWENDPRNMRTARKKAEQREAADDLVVTHVADPNQETSS